MKERKREDRFVTLALCMALLAAFGLGGIGIAGAYGRAGIVPVGGGERAAFAEQASLSQSRYGDIDPTEIYTLASSQTVVVEAPKKSDPENMFVYGAGFLISRDGYIMTNCHVVSDLQSADVPVQVRTFDGRVYPVEIVGADQDSDIALLKAEGYFEAAALGDSDRLQPCQQVYIMGHPDDELCFTMTSGIISALGRSITFSDGTTLDMFQLDAAVNFGNSGGPVYNSRGEVIGITTAKFASLYAEGLGFALPINEALRIAEDLRSSGYVRGRPLMGLTVRNIEENELAEDSPAGVLVFDVLEGFCGEDAGLRKGDIILSMDGVRVTTTTELANAKKPYRAGDTVTLEVWRDGKTFTTRLTFAEVTPEHPTGSLSQDELDRLEQEDEAEETPED